jgi:hypothetical protein
MLLSMRAGRGRAFWRDEAHSKIRLGPSQEPTCGCRKRARRSAPCFRPVLYRELCNCSACRGYGNRIPTDHSCAPVLHRSGRDVGVRKQLRVEKRASILLNNRNLQETVQRERVNCQRPGHRAANSVCSLSPFGERVVRGLQNYRETLTPHPHLSQPKSDLSNFGRLKVPNSGKPEFGGRGCRPSSPQPSSLPGSSRQSIVFAKRFSKNDGPAGQARG